MNKTRRSILALLEQQYKTMTTNNVEDVKRLKESFESLLEEEQEAYDNMPEGFQNGSRGMDSEDAMDEMQDYIDLLDEIIEDMEG